ncbi:hypothetical protein [Rhodococcus sp. BH5]|uniref:hypothetical protein n=1 Tax=Rhodococcus sp. BH5 TaxID=2871702 RepID=UPI0022CD3EEC|nr:hypothetical protein [Rhodococcus sp. BH5]MCZ9635045.1 hypothetical protein [Rhodococcus sp. BH5]
MAKLKEPSGLPKSMIAAACAVAALLLVAVTLVIVSLSRGDDSASGPVSTSRPGPPPGRSIADLTKDNNPPDFDVTIGMSPATGMPPMDVETARRFSMISDGLDADPAGPDSAARPAGLQWAKFGYDGLPVGPTVGPTTIDGHCTSGFAHTLQGAVAAAIQKGTRAALFGECAELYGIPTTEQSAWDHLRLLLAPITLLDRTTFVGVGQVWIDESDPDVVAFELIGTRNPDGTRYALRVQMQWSDGDWNQVLTDDIDVRRTILENDRSWTSWQ